MSDTKAPIRLVIATGNAGKVRDFETVFAGSEHPVEVVSITQFGGMPEVVESEPDFRGNARLKAQAAQSSVPTGEGWWTLADDSGLSVDALKGAPGVYSARFAGPDATDADNREKLLQVLDGIPMEKRGAHFTCHLCLISPEGEIWNFEGICEGSIAFASSGTNGFGYDPLFIQKGDSLTWGELDKGHKNADSHRGRATQKLLRWFGEHF